MDYINDSKNLSKRRFIKTCALGICGLALGLDHIEAFEKTLTERFITLPHSDDAPGKWSKEAEFYDITSDGLKCQKCPHGCLLAEGTPASAGIE